MSRAFTSIAGTLLLCGHAVAALATPQPVAPTANTRTSATPTFQWTESPGAKGYTLQIVTVTQMVVFDKSIGATTSYTLPEENALPLGTSFGWRILASSDAESSSYSEFHSFQAGRLRRYSVLQMDLVPAGVYNPNGVGYAGVHLPHGAVIVGFKSHWRDLDASPVGGDVEIQFVRSSWSGVNSVVCNASSSGYGGVSSTTAPIISNPVVNNHEFSYAVKVWVNDFYLVAKHTFYRADIEYLD